MYGWHKEKRSNRIHWLENNKPVCKLDRSDSWPGITDTSQEFPRNRAFCKICQRLTGIEPGIQFDQGEFTNWPRTDWSDMRKYDETIPPWSDRQIVIGVWSSKEDWLKG